ncbi:hypothetical protein QEH32_gp42 [Corynebacterium phage EmiRose]|uniref:Uncharacterized protein n=1 Tax=Corynebacterium phage EmiRose TaxID=2565372 RepID=A0A649VPQ6_9CAUD|nr:hypothetical protein QEH32_gp42 [Corynebacterium phage EmiRose]QGJ94174.1 hypothetical protein SEA_EMIROSE_42 [Corynebacterium phage EmiRose]
MSEITIKSNHGHSVAVPSDMYQLGATLSGTRRILFERARLALIELGELPQETPGDAVDTAFYIRGIQNIASEVYAAAKQVLVDAGDKEYTSENGRHAEIIKAGVARRANYNHLLKYYPDVYEKCVTVTPGSPRLILKPGPKD